MEKVNAFLKRKNIVFSAKRYGIDALGAMAQGLFCSLLIGTILNTLGTQFHIGFLTAQIGEKVPYTIGGLTSFMSGPAMAIAIGYALQAPPLVLFSLAAVGYACNLLGGAGGPLAVLFVAIIAAECGKAVSKETKIDILVTPIVTTLIGVGTAYVIAPPIGTAASAFGMVIMKATELQPFLMGILVSVLVGVALTLPISSAAICSVLGLTGLAGGAAVAGWQGARNLSGEAGLIMEDADLFPPQNVTQGGMKIYADRPAPMVIGYANAVVQTAGSGLAPLFEQMMHDQNGRRYSVDTFRRYESGGLGATIRGDVVLMGSIAFMKLMRVRVPEGTRLKQAVYLSVNGELAAVFALNYAPAESVRAGLASVLRAGALVPVLATRDFMITPQFLKQRYKIPPEHIEFPIVEERAALSEPGAVRAGKQGALMARSSFASFAGSVVAARGLRGTAILSICVAIAGSVLGVSLMFVLTFLGADLAASCWNLFLYTVLWLLPGLLAGLLAGRA